MANPYYTGPVTDHFDGTRFFNPGQPDTDRSLSDILRWKLRSTPARWPRSVPVRQAVPKARVAGLRLTMVGHATVLIQAAGLNILTDPVWSDRAGIAFEQLPPIDAILLSHNHYDHLDVATLRRLQAAHRPLLVAPLGNEAIVKAALPDMRVASGDWGDRIDLGAGVHSHLVPALHWSARRARDRRMALWAGHMIRTPAGSVWFAGDTGYGDGAIFRALKAVHGAPDVALIPIGAYEPRWFMAAQHVNPQEAVRIFRGVGARQALGIHWGTFQLTDEARDAPPAALAAALAADAIAADRFVAAEPGHVLDLTR